MGMGMPELYIVVFILFVIWLGRWAYGKPK